MSKEMRVNPLFNLLALSHCLDDLSDAACRVQIKFVAGKDEALAAFAGRREVLSRVLGPAEDDELISRFFDDVRARPGEYLFVDPEDVFVAWDEPEEGHYHRCSRVVDVIDAEGATAADVAEALKPYSSVGFDGRGEEEVTRQVTGYTYR